MSHHIKLKINLIIYKIKSKIFRNLLLLSKTRSGSCPFITGDDFRKIADYIYDDIDSFNPKKVKEGDIIFVKGDMIFNYFKTIHPLIRNKYKLVTHNSDQNIGKVESEMIDNKIIRWFAQNNIFYHSKITPIPIGIENKRFCRTGQELIRATKKKKGVKKDKILFGFRVINNTKERTEALNSLRLCSSADKIDGIISPRDYFKKLKEYKFVASPPGNGEDCYRTWEALYLGITPIVKESVCMNYFKNIGLPILILPGYHYNDLDINKINLPKNDELLDMNYWVRIIKNCLE